MSRLTIAITIALVAVTSAIQWPDLHHPDWRSSQPSWDKVHSLSGARVSHRVQHEHVQLEYDIDHHDNIMALHLVPDLRFVQCESAPAPIESITIAIAAEQSSFLYELFVERLARAAPLLLAGHCSPSHSASRSLHVAVTAVSRGAVDGLLHLSTVPVGIEQYFRHANISFVTDQVPADQLYAASAGGGEPVIVQHTPHALRSRDQSGSGGWFSSLWSAAITVWQTVQEAPKILNTVVNIVSQVCQIASGEYNPDPVSADATLAWNYDSTSGTAINKTIPIWQSSGGTGTVVCQNCYAALDVSIKFTLQISNYQLQAFSAIATGSTELNLDFMAQYHSTETSAASTTFTDLIPSFLIPIPLPVPLYCKVSMPITIGYSLTTKIDAVLNIAVKAKGSVMQGVVYNPSTGGMDPVSTRDLAYSGAITPSGSLTISSTLNVYLTPTVVIDVATLGGPSFALKLGAEALFAISTADDSSTNCPASQMLVTLNAQAQLTVAGKLSVATKTLASFGPLPLLSLKRTLYTACLDLAASSPLSANAPLAIGLGASPPSGLVAGTSYSGLVQQGTSYIMGHDDCSDGGDCCGNFDPVLALQAQLSFQVGDVMPTGGPLNGRQWIGSVVQRTSTGSSGAGAGACISSLGFVFEGGDPALGCVPGHVDCMTSMTMYPSLLSYTQCTDGVSAVLGQLRWRVAAPGGDYSTLVLVSTTASGSGGGCLQATLTRN